MSYNNMEMKNQIYWLTDSDIHDIDYYDESLNIEIHTYTPPSILDKIKRFFKSQKSKSLKSNRNIDFKEIATTVLLKPIKKRKYKVISKGNFPFLIYIFKYHLFEEKFASKIIEVSDNKIKFERVNIFEDEKLYEEKTYFRLEAPLKEIELEECAMHRSETHEIFLAHGSCLYFSESLKLKLESFIEENYPTFKFVAGIPILVC